MATSKPKAVASPPPNPTLYHVSLRMQVGSLAGDAEYHVQMTEREIESLLNGTATVVRLPARFGRSKAAGQLADEWRFLPLSNIVEITLTDLEWPAAEYIAETMA
jgi:hypothetical protein